MAHSVNTTQQSTQRKTLQNKTSLV